MGTHRRNIAALISVMLVARCSSAFPIDIPRADSLRSAGFVHFYNNEYDQALALFEQDLKQHPTDPAAYNSVAQAILYREMYRDGALESQLVTGSNSFLRRRKMEVSAQDKARFNDAVSQAISLSEEQLARNPKDVRALYSTAVAWGLRANFLFLVEKSWMQALHATIAGRKADDQILEIDPGFTDAHLLHGLSEYVVGCMPAYLRLLGAANGFHGDKEDGIRQLQMVAESKAGNRFDAAILLAAIYRRERRPADAIPLLNMLATTFPRNHLFRFEQVQLYSDAGNKASALHVLSQIEDLREGKMPGFEQLPIERIEYARGNLLFWYGDLHLARENLQAASKGTESLDLSTAVMTWLRLGQTDDLLGDRTRASEAYRKATETAPSSEPAKEAESYINKPYSRRAK